MKIIKPLLLCSLSVIFLFACGENTEQNNSPFSNESPADKGAKLFKDKCATCHSMATDIAGPALNGVINRWGNDTATLKAFIKDSQGIIKSGDPHAVATFEKYRTTMPSFPSFTDEELSQLLAFLKN